MQKDMRRRKIKSVEDLDLDLRSDSQYAKLRHAASGRYDFFSLLNDLINNASPPEKLIEQYAGGFQTILAELGK